MKYLDFFNKLKMDIERGDLKPGSKIPSIRTFVEREEISKNTVIKGLHLLEDSGYIESRAKSGFYVSFFNPSLRPKVGSLVPEKINPVSKKVQRGDIIEDLLSSELSSQILPLGTALRFPDILPSKNINSIFNSIIKKYPNHSANYSFPMRDDSVNVAIFNHLYSFSEDIHHQGVVNTFGATEAISLSLRLVTKPGDTVLVESPVFFGILLILKSLNLKVVEVPSQYGQGYKFHELEKILKSEKISAAIFSPNFTNPHGGLYSDECKDDLVRFFNSKRIPLIEDDVNGDLAFSGVRPKMLASFDKKGLVFSCSSFSKTLGAGYRIGWIYNSKYFNELKMLKLSNNFSSQPFIELAVSQYLKEKSYKRFLKKLTSFFEENLKQVKHYIREYFPEDCHYSEPAGGFSIWIKLPPKTSSIEFYNKALVKNIAIAPGVIFSNSLKYNSYIRINCGADCNYELAIKTLGEVLNK